MRSVLDPLGGDPERITPRSRWIWRSTIPYRWTASVRVYALFFNALSGNSKGIASDTNSFVGAPMPLDNFRVVPPATGIVHQVNLEYLGQVVMSPETSAMVGSLPTRIY